MAKPNLDHPRKGLLVSLGVFFVGLGGLGILLPGLPTTPFLLVAAACFAKSSPRLHGLLLQNRLFGPLIRNWEENRTIPGRARNVALLTVLLFGGFALYSIKAFPLKMVVLLLLVAGVLFLLRLRVTEDEGGRSASDKKRE